MKICKICNQELPLTAHPLTLYCPVCKPLVRRKSSTCRIKRRAKGLCIDCGIESKSRRCAKCNIPVFARRRAIRAVQKEAVFDHYGHVCACCGEANKGFLTFDHINGGGREHTRLDSTARDLPRWLFAHNFPEGFQVLCYNCNCGRHHHGQGICPHKLV